MIVERTDFISVPVTDMERSTSFYAQTLGLPWLDEGSQQWPEFQLGETCRSISRTRRYAPRD